MFNGGVAVEGARLYPDDGVSVNLRRQVHVVRTHADATDDFHRATFAVCAVYALINDVVEDEPFALVIVKNMYERKCRRRRNRRTDSKSDKYGTSKFSTRNAHSAFTRFFAHLRLG